MTPSIQKNYDSFLRLNVNNYLDEWIAVVDGNIVAHGKHVKDVYHDVKKQYPTKRPLITKVHSKKAMIL